MFKSFTSKVNDLRKVVKYAFLTIRLVSKNTRMLFIGTIAEEALVVTFPLVNAFIYKDIIDIAVQYIQHKGQLFPELYILFAIRLLVSFLQMLGNSVDTLLMKSIYRVSEMEFDHVVLAKYAQMDVYHFESQKLKDLFDKVDDNRWRIKDYVVEVISMCQYILQMVLSLLAVVFVLPIIILFVIVATIPTVFIDIRYSKIAWGIWDAKTHLRKLYWYNNRLLTQRDARKEIKLFQMGEPLLHQAYGILKNFAESDFKIAKRTFVVNFPFIFLNNFLYTGIELYMILQTAFGKITIGSLSYVTLVLGQFSTGFTNFVKSFARLYDHSLYMESLFEFLSIENVILDKENAVILDPQKPHSIEFRNISFTYPETSKPIFNDFSLTIHSGEKIALVGENGAGKTTLIKLLVRFYDVDSGGIYIDGINIKEVNLDSWHKCIGILFQDFLKYEASVKENVQAGKMHDMKKDLEDIIDASKKSSAHEFVEKFEKQYEQVLGTRFEDSAELSGGQWQKIALARGFLRDASILVLDEPTASIDAKAEYEIFQKLESLQHDKTVIIISHRFSTVRNAQTIYVLADGKIVESGTHEELIKENGTYSNLFNLQAAGYR
jgi:ATP-binding cassette subfamily B protein